MTEKERRAFEQELKDKPDLASEVAFLKKAYLYLQKRKEREALKSRLQAAAVQYQQRAKRGRRFHLSGRSLLSLAATLALLIAVIWLFNRTQPQSSSYADLAQHAPLALTEMSSNEQQLITTAEQAFNTGDYAKAAETLRQYLLQQPDDQVARLYLAISLIETGQTTDARELLQSLSNSPDFRDKALWYTALSYFKENKQEEARKYLKLISPSAKEHEKAQELLHAH